jgi:hypothetical protein
MEHMLNFIITLTDTASDLAEMLFSAFPDARWFSTPGSGIVFSLAAGAAFTNGDTEDIAGVRLWRSGIADRFSAIDNLVNIIRVRQSTWAVPDNMFSQLIVNRNRLQELINRCNSSTASCADREQRDTLLKSTINLCLTHVKTWVHNEFAAGTLTAEDVHLLGFLLPDETNRHRRTKDSDTATEENGINGNANGLLNEAELRRMEIEHLKAGLPPARE